MAKVSFLLGAAAGYVLGARAGRKRYEQIRSGAAQVWQSQPVQKQVATAKHAAKTKAAPAALDAVSTAAAATGEKMRQGASKIASDPDRDVPSRTADETHPHGTHAEGDPLSEWYEEGGHLDRDTGR